MDEKIKFHLIVEREVIDIGYGVVTINVVLQNGVPQVQTLNITKSKRIKYGRKGKSEV